MEYFPRKNKEGYVKKMKTSGSRGFKRKTNHELDSNGKGQNYSK